MSVPSPAEDLTNPKSLNWQIGEKSAGARPHFFLSNEPYAKYHHKNAAGHLGVTRSESY
jgi:hypothetical protein